MKAKIFVLPTLKNSQLSIIGSAEKHCLVVIRKAEADQKTITDLLKAIKLTEADDVVKVILDSDESLHLAPLLDQYKIQHVISFGFEPNDLGLNIPAAYNHPFKIADRTIILTQSIADLNTHKDQKMALWKTLQSVFLT